MSKSIREQLEGKGIYLYSPIGVAVFPHLNEPDDYKNQVRYKVNLKLSREEHADFLKQIEEMSKVAFELKRKELKQQGGKKAALAKELTLHVPFEDEYDDEGDPTGFVLLKAHMNAFVKDKRTGKTQERRLPIYDAKGKELKNPPLIRSGSEIRLSLHAFAIVVDAIKKAGISLRMSAVQIVKLNAGGVGFDAVDVEDAYVADSNTASVDEGPEDEEAPFDTDDEDTDPDFA